MRLAPRRMRTVPRDDLLVDRSEHLLDEIAGDGRGSRSGASPGVGLARDVGDCCCCEQDAPVRFGGDQSGKPQVVDFQMWVDGRP